MKKILAFLVGAATFSIQAQAQPSVTNLQTESQYDSIQAKELISGEYLDGLVQYAMQEHHLPGVVISIVHNDSLVFAKGWGEARLDSKAAVDPERTLFRIASISKTFTFTAIMQLVEKGQITLDEDISTYLQGVDIKGSEKYGSLTMMHLMTHSGGFEDTYLGHFYADSPETDYPRTFYLNHYQPARVRPPGEVISYSNYGVSLAGKVLEDVSGKEFEKYMEQEVLHPMAMMRSSFRDGPHLDTKLAKDRATAYQWSGGRYLPFKDQYLPRGGYPAASLSTTAVDMARFMRAHLGNGTVDSMSILQPETAERMHRVLFRNAKGIPGNAHGFWTETIAGYETIGHRGSVLGFLSSLILVPELDLGIFISTNGSSGDSFVTRLPRMLITSITPSTSHAPAPDSSLMKRAEIYTGIYMSTRRGYSTIDKIIELIDGMVNVSIAKSGHLVITGLGDAQRYVPAGDHRFVEVSSGNVISFDVTDGQATRFFMTTTAFERVGFWQTSQAFFLVVVLSFIAFIGALLGFWMRRNREIKQTAQEKLVSIMTGITVLSWLLSLGTLIYSMSIPRGQESSLLVHFPDLWTGIALWGTLISAILTGALLFGLIPIWRHRSWDVWRNIRHTTLVGVMIVLTLMLWQWNAIGIQITGG